MANEENLIPLSQRTKSEQREIQSKGGVNSGKSRRHKRDLRKTAQMLLSMPVHDGKLEKITALDSVNGKNMAVDEALMLKLIECGLNDGDVRAIKTLFDLVLPAAKNGDPPDTVRTQSNILQALALQSEGEIDTHDIPEIQQAANSDHDVVEPSGVPR